MSAFLPLFSFSFIYTSAKFPTSYWFVSYPSLFLEFESFWSCKKGKSGYFYFTFYEEGSFY
jgi:hypothetical protein